jgi:ribosomal protein L14
VVERSLAEVFKTPGQETAVKAALQNRITVRRTRSPLTVRDGRSIAVDESASPIVDDRGSVVGGVVVFRPSSD